MDPEFMTRYLPEGADEPDGVTVRSLDTEPDVDPEPDIAVVSEPEARELYPAPAESRGHAPAWLSTSGEHNGAAAATDGRQPDSFATPPTPAFRGGNNQYARAHQAQRASDFGGMEVTNGQARTEASSTPAMPDYPGEGRRTQLDQQWDGGATHFGSPASSVPMPLRAEDVVPTRKVPPDMGWRKAVYVGSGHAVNLGAGPGEKQLRDQIALIKTNIPGNYQVAVLGLRGGVGKTRTTAGIGTAYASYRTEPVICIDANPCYGTLGRVVDPSAPSTIREFLADADVSTYPKARQYTGKNEQGLEVLAANQNVANPLFLGAECFDAIMARISRFYQLSMIDCGPTIEHPVMEAILHSADALVVVGTMNYDGAIGAETTINWLAAHNFHELLRRSVLILNDVHDSADKTFVTKVRETMGRRVGGVTTIPFDEHLRDGAVLDFDALKRTTRLAYIELAAWLAQGFQSARAEAR
ncbi:MinD/ParA family ATP-binding protein [Mycolicibacterium septicum]|uniref:MinD/ParA family ATP-binding protein n=1 Tax=Mycolicibacterium septicum TaxID=98668 RepID=UPI00235F0B39|nr:MinD/ParA family protein [Mycolicibacterium septicum]